MIPSPYNFVPLSKKIFFPQWAELASMDVPFSDGISGTINIRVKACTPIYIRNTQNKSEDEADIDFYRVTDGGKYAIPGTSFKGMLRNVVEIITFSKIAGSRGKSSRVSEHRYAVRDLQNRDVYTSKMTETIAQNAYKSKSHAGWLSEDDEGNWAITPCDFARVEQEELEEHFGMGDKAIGRRMSSAKKYDRIKPYTKVKFSHDQEREHKHHRVNLVYKKVTKLSGGDKDGIVVLTGQPNDRGASGRKHMEFIFFDEMREHIAVPKDIKEDFIFIHSELGENRKPNEEWGFWSKKLKEGARVPVFFLWDKTEGDIKSMGLALMFRLPYEFTVLDAVEHTSADHTDSSRLDMGETMFGRVEDKSALRGRVNVETLLAEGEPQTMEPVRTVLGMPRPTYYPNYVKQRAGSNDPEKTGRYKTLMDADCEISGWKRYLARKDSFDVKNVPDAPSANVQTVFSPLPAGTQFSGKIHLHNVKPEELGALVWALTWGGNAKLLHSIGMGKPYGFGSVSVSITGSELSWCNPSLSEPVDLEACKAVFLQLMESNIGRQLVDTDEIKALTAMANPELEWEQLQPTFYPVLRGGKSFVDHKNAKEILTFKYKLPEKKRPQQPVQEVKPLVKLKGADKLVDELSRAKVLNFKDVKALIKSCGITPDTAAPEDKVRIHEQLQKQLKNADNQLRKLISEWS